MSSVDPKMKSCSPEDPKQDPKRDTSLGSITNISPKESRRFLDKQTLSYASLLGMLEDTHLEGTQFSWVASVFYFGYMFWSYPTMYLSVRLPIGKYLGTTVLVWAAVLMCHAACHNFAGLVITRFFLGALEASIAPGFSLITGMWYTRRQQPLRYGLWFTGGSIASLFGGLLSYGIGHINNSLAAWQYLFLIFGAVTALWGIVMLVFLPDTPSKAYWLTPEEQSTAIKNIMADGQAGVRSSFKMSQVFEALRDPVTWFLSLYTFCVNIANGGLTAFGSLVVQGFGYEGLQALLIQMPTGGAQLCFVIISAVLCSSIPNIRMLTMMALTLISLLGMVLMYALEESNQAGRMAGFCLSLAFSANMPLAMSLITSNVRGLTKRAVVNASVLVMYCVGNIVGPQFFSVIEAPRYRKGITASLVGFGLGFFWLVCLRLYLQWQNKKRASEVPSDVPPEGLLLEDLTDWETPGCRYVL
ncbi:uncharacterized protein N7479_009722 [Penicillium vulpinum]|uniref:Major facilitator superfamily (MFS) profile domain-containing protein n=1 Tax=Penicillium vulpinum TaxID=29845 RepID=A0A1V6RY26_9EURO|nr:uncharacterized protein N7479_009722 [Penicillium vulpinum]KAJ5951309.1 hypothetical protein N7479_009722 [Penicillium vulpinum]OQE06671.1 hypothetical protein PENVUL_c017G04332 [Penicillium vulpinum]